MGKATSNAKIEIEEKCFCRMGSGRELALVLVVDSINLLKPIGFMHQQV
jgi:hypothetical protein